MERVSTASDSLLSGPLRSSSLYRLRRELERFRERQAKERARPDTCGFDGQRRCFEDVASPVHFHGSQGHRESRSSFIDLGELSPYRRSRAGEKLPFRGERRRERGLEPTGEVRLGSQVLLEADLDLGPHGKGHVRSRATAREGGENEQCRSESAHPETGSKPRSRAWTRVSSSRNERSPRKPIEGV